MCDVDSSGSWGKGKSGWLLSQPIRGKRQGRRGRESERTDVQEEGKEVERGGGGCK